MTDSVTKAKENLMKARLAYMDALAERIGLDSASPENWAFPPSIADTAEKTLKAIGEAVADNPADQPPAFARLNSAVEALKAAQKEWIAAHSEARQAAYLLDKPLPPTDPVVETVLNWTGDKLTGLSVSGLHREPWLMHNEMLDRFRDVQQLLGKQSDMLDVIAALLASQHSDQRLEKLGQNRLNHLLASEGLRQEASVKQGSETAGESTTGIPFSLIPIAHWFPRWRGGKTPGESVLSIDELLRSTDPEQSQND